MQTITFTCETITPMFLSGADGTTPELRPPSIKGALRFWWRAMNGHLPTKSHNEFNYLPLKDREQQIFGGVGFGEKANKVEAQRSAFNVRISNTNESANSAKNDFDKDGLRYLFYLIVPDDKGKQMSENDKAFRNVTSFDVIFSADDEDVLLQACASFWLLTYFGGLGSRARRGGGNFEIYYVEDEANILKDKLTMMPTDESINFLKEGIEQVAKILKQQGNGQISNQYSTLKSSEIYVSKNPKKDWKEALDDIGSMMKNIRTDTKMKDRDQTQETLDQKAAFGLPISVRNEKSVVEFDNTKDFNHRASPIIISIVKLGKKYYWTLVYLQGEFMPPDTKIVFQSEAYNKTFEWQDVDDELLKKFIDDKVVPNTSIRLTF